MAKKKKVKKDIKQYDHADKERLNNPPVGLVSEDTEPYKDTKKTYEYDPHFDPQLVWAGKASIPPLKYRPSASMCMNALTRKR
ncbi:MAG: hypothetical protein SWO11_19060 [Thermodesulfobacteriota bacterium]|nr:hypothetical protein [Thermodesulfobacteriota bacterium]